MQEPAGSAGHTPRRSPRRRWLLAPLVILTPLFGFLFVQWRSGTIHGGQRAAQPFRIAGNLYYVGTNDVTAFLITGPQGHILIDGGYPGTPPLIEASIARLGFRIRDVRILLNSEPHYDHAGGLAELQRASGAQLWASAASAEALVRGGAEPGDPFLPHKLLVWSGLARYPAPRVDHRLRDGEVVRLGSIALTAHLTPGHTRGCTTWTFVVREGQRDLNVVSACSLKLMPGLRLADPQRYPGVRGDFERSFRVLRSLPVDIWVTSHARVFGRYRKYAARATAIDSAAPFIDREGYRRYVDEGEASFRGLLAQQQRQR